MAKKVLNGTANCLLEVCCASTNGDPHPNALAQMAQLIHEGTDCGLTPEQESDVAAFIYANFDLAERGTLTTLKASIVRVFSDR